MHGIAKYASLASLLVLAASASGAGAQQKIIKDCQECPSLVAVPAGSFLMGSLEAETTREAVPDEMASRERPQHSVTIGKPFAIGRTEITRSEYAAFVADTKYEVQGPCRTIKPAAEQRLEAGWPGNLSIRNDISWRDAGFPQTDTHPAVCVSWDDIQVYVAWLTKKTGHVYRLPTEAEWEYAARAGNPNARYGSDKTTELCKSLNGGDADFTNTYPAARASNKDCSDGYVYTAPVASFAPNAWGLYDIYGNVWEWVQDCMHPNGYAGAPSDGSEWKGAADCQRVSRGSSWFGVPRSFRAAFRVWDPPAYRGAGVGFRVVRELP
jgi:sulfatase modifying factor 1